MIEFDGISLRLGEFSLRDVTLHIGTGEYFFIIGPSGAGKTVLLEAIAGLHSPDGGRILLRQKDVRTTPPEDRRISLMYQDYSLFPHMTVEENISFGLKMQQVSPEKVKERVRRIMERFGIANLANRLPRTMSGGEQQRVALARALVVEPDVLLLDEPLAALDPITRDFFTRELARIREEYGLTVVHVSHSREEALRLATRVAVIIDGRLVAEGTREEIFSAPPYREIARFVGMENILDGEVIGTAGGYVTIRIGKCRLRAPDRGLKEGDKVAACIRAHEIRISPTPPAGREENVLSGRIVSMLSDGAMVRMTLETPFTPMIADVHRSKVIRHGLKEGMEVFLWCPPDAVVAAPSLHPVESS
ncbi:MAG TPA: ATP-binding cassette domain-containing protein [Methanoculleus sp.]|nr:ATP-binding cassette domain-containing protein [Methanoculleus sp.]